VATPQQQFIADIYPDAKKVSEDTGSSIELILAQTALETGWGHKVLPGTNNLYNIKADSSWHGKTAEFTVPEQDKAGNVYMSKEKFRVYESYADSMIDRKKFLAENHRYAKSGLFDPDVKGNLEKEAEALQKAGYATDKHYAAAIIGTARGPTMRAGIAIAEGRSPEAHGKDHRGALRKGDQGDAVSALQASLAEIGYKDANGNALKADSHFGPGTDFAVKAFQLEHGLHDDGIAGQATLAAIHDATKAQGHGRATVPSMVDVGHPAKGMYDQAFQCVAQLDRDHRRETGPHTQMLSGSLVSAATAAGFNRIDHVALSDDATRAYAVQGDLNSPFKQYADVNVMQAIQTPITQSSAEAATHIQANEQATMLQSQQQVVPQQAQDTQQQANALQR
jgi:flagellum-specific peptidoglycan hydrolase FlgJ